MGMTEQRDLEEEEVAPENDIFEVSIPEVVHFLVLTRSRIHNSGNVCLGSNGGKGQQGGKEQAMDRLEYWLGHPRKH